MDMRVLNRFAGAKCILISVMRRDYYRLRYNHAPMRNHSLVPIRLALVLLAARSHAQTGTSYEVLYESNVDMKMRDGCIKDDIFRPQRRTEKGPRKLPLSPRSAVAVAVSPGLQSVERPTRVPHFNRFAKTAA
jgi:hypothetical protein